jgi:hypothetical protein
LDRGNIGKLEWEKPHMVDKKAPKQETYVSGPGTKNKQLRHKNIGQATSRPSRPKATTRPIWEPIQRERGTPRAKQAETKSQKSSMKGKACTRHAPESCQKSERDF